MISNFPHLKHLKNNQIIERNTLRLVPIEHFSPQDWLPEDRQNFLRKKFSLLSYQQIAQSKLTNIQGAEKSQQMLDQIFKKEKNVSLLGSTNTLYCIGTVQKDPLQADHVNLYNKTLLAMMKNKFGSDLLKKVNKINNLGKPSSEIFLRGSLSQTSITGKIVVAFYL